MALSKKPNGDRTTYMQGQHVYVHLDSLPTTFDMDLVSVSISSSTNNNTPYKFSLRDVTQIIAAIYSIIKYKLIIFWGGWGVFG